MKIEILHDRNPDADCELTVFVDGVEFNDFLVADVDPGKGYTLEDWRETTEFHRTQPGLSDEFRREIVAVRDLAEESEFITDDGYV